MTRSLSVVLLTLFASIALAEPPGLDARPEKEKATELVRKKLLTPLQRSQSKRKMFSRAAPAPSARRVRLLDAQARTDARGKRFVRFAVDERFTWDEVGRWREGTMQGCAYPADGHVFVQHGDTFVSASSLLGSSPRPHSEACRAEG